MSEFHEQEIISVVAVTVWERCSICVNFWEPESIVPNLCSVFSWGSGQGT